MQPYSRVIAPMMVTTVRAASDWLNSGALRAIRYTPAVTIVAAWMSADTGVGPSIASPSQDCNGTCADLPQAASSSASPIAVSTPSLAASARVNTSANSIEPNVENMIMIARISPMSPTRLTTNAFFAAAAADGLYCQNPMSRYEARPTPSH